MLYRPERGLGRRWYFKPKLAVAAFVLQGGGTIVTKQMLLATPFTEMGQKGGWGRRKGKEMWNLCQISMLLKGKARARWSITSQSILMRERIKLFEKFISMF